MASRRLEFELRCSLIVWKEIVGIARGAVERGRVRKEGRKGLSVFPRTSGWSGALEQAFFSLALEASLVSGWVNRGWEGPQR